MGTLPICPKCGAEAASTRRTCPLCGTPLQRPSPWVPMFGALALLALAALGAVLLWAARPLYQDAVRYSERVRTTQGTVIHVERRESTNASGHTRFVYYPKVAFIGAVGMQAVEVGLTYRRVEAGQSVTVYFDPDDVGQVSLDPPSAGAPEYRLIGFASSGLLLIVIGCGGLVGIMRHVRKHWFTTPARSPGARATARIVVLGLLATVGSGCGDDGPRSEGDTCAAAVECQSGLLCRPDAQGTSRCTPPLAECSLCTGNPDCQAGLVCVAFSDGTQRCGSGLGATTCRVP